MSFVIKTDEVDQRDAFWFLRHRADVLKCCGIVDNLHITELPNKTHVAVCVKCGRKHYKMAAESGKIGAIFGR